MAVGLEMVSLFIHKISYYSINISNSIINFTPNTNYETLYRSPSFIFTFSTYSGHNMQKFLTSWPFLRNFTTDGHLLHILYLSSVLFGSLWARSLLLWNRLILKLERRECDKNYKIIIRPQIGKAVKIKSFFFNIEACVHL
jgi:hypothetical protein